MYACGMIVHAQVTHLLVYLFIVWRMDFEKEVERANELQRLAERRETAAHELEEASRRDKAECRRAEAEAIRHATSKIEANGAALLEARTARDNAMAEAGRARRAEAEAMEAAQRDVW